MVMELFFKTEVQDKYLPTILPQMFLDRKKRLVVFVMKLLQSKSEPITPETVVSTLKVGGDEIESFKKKHYIYDLSDQDVFDMSNDLTVTIRENYTKVVYEQLIKHAFSRYVYDSLYDMDDYNDNFNEKAVILKAKNIPKVYDIFHNRLNVEREDQLQSTLELINSDNEYVRTMSQALNSYMGGFTRGYVGTIGAKSGHTKSSFTDFNIVQNLLTDKVKKVLIISPEEMAQLRWRRAIATLCRIPTSHMRQKQAMVTEDHIKIVREKLWDRLQIEDKVDKMADIIKLMEETDADMVYVDHLQSITYPGYGSAMENMIGNIPGLVNIEKRIAKEKNIPIVNLSQVNDKDIQRSDRLIKAPRYWDLYGSSVLYQAARELLMLWYQYKDYEDNPMIYDRDNPPSVNRIYVILEKSSFSATTKIPMFFDPEFNVFRDEKPETLKKLSHKAMPEKDIAQLTLI